MRFIVFGAGAIGGVIGGRLFEHGHEVVLIARGEHHRALSKEGLRLESPESISNLTIPTVESPRALTFEDGDVVLVAVKSQDTEDAVRALAEVAPSSVPLVCAQNGVENERVTLRLFSDVYGMCVMCPASHLRPGVVQAHSAPVTGILDLGRWPGGVDDRAREIAEALRESGFSSEARDDIARWKWGKLIMNLANAVEAVCAPGAWSGALARRAREEAVACLDAAGIAYVGTDEDRARRADLLKLLPIDGVPRGGGSSWQSLERRAGTIEADYLNGEMVLLGRLHGVPTPVNALLQRLANQFALTKRQPGSMSEAEVLRLLD